MITHEEALNKILSHQYPNVPKGQTKTFAFEILYGRVFAIKAKKLSDDGKGNSRFEIISVDCET